MLIPLIVIGVLFLITWIVIAVCSPDSVPVEPSKPNCSRMLIDPYHTCRGVFPHPDCDSYWKARAKELEARNDYLRRDLQRALDRNRCNDLMDRAALKTPEELFKELCPEPKPTEIKIENATVTITEKAKKR